MITSKLHSLGRRLMPLMLFVMLTLPAQAFCKVYMVAVGIADYPGQRNDLTLPARDARTMKSLFDSTAGTESVMITNSDATRSAILSSLRRLFGKAGAEDIVIFFFSGHGYQGGFMAYDGKLSYADMRAAIASSPCKNRMIFADACFSGKMRQGKRRPSSDSRNSNVMLFLSSRDNEVSMESPSMANGFFTTALRNGLSGKADTNRDRVVTARELFNYVSNSVRSLSDDRQHPVMWGKFSDNMPVMRW